MVRSIHAAVKGRVRFRIDGLYRSNPLKKYLEDRLAEKEEITRCSANFLSGHAVVCFNPSLSASTITLLINETVETFYQGNGHKKGAIRKESFYETFFADAPSSPSKALVFSSSARPKTQIPGKGKTRRLVLHGADQKIEPWHVQSTESLLVTIGIQPHSGLSNQDVL